MKLKLLAIIFVLIIPLMSVGCKKEKTVSSNPPPTKQTLHTYVLSTMRCGSLFGVGPEDCIKTEIENAAFPYNQMVEQRLDDAGNYVFVLTDEQIDIWREYHLAELEELLGIIEEQGEQGFELNRDYTKFVGKIGKNGIGLFLFRYFSEIGRAHV